jgi:hypothetical protein
LIIASIGSARTTVICLLDSKPNLLNLVERSDLEDSETDRNFNKE